MRALEGIRRILTMRKSEEDDSEEDENARNRRKDSKVTVSTVETFLDNVDTVPSADTCLESNSGASLGQYLL